MSIKIAPSILAADFGRLAEEVRAAEAAGGDLVHVDVMDGRFVSNITIGPVVVQAVRAAARTPLHVHLMIVEPDRYVRSFADAGAGLLYIHVEATPHVHGTLQQIRAAGVQAGVALNPHTSIDALRVVLPLLSSVLVMTVNPGFGGQAFIKETLPKIEELKHEIVRRGLDCEIAVDGGIDSHTAADVVKAGARVLVAGTAVFRAPDYGVAVRDLRAAAARGLA